MLKVSAGSGTGREVDSSQSGLDFRDDMLWDGNSAAVTLAGVLPRLRDVTDGRLTV